MTTERPRMVYMELYWYTRVSGMEIARMNQTYGPLPLDVVLTMCENEGLLIKETFHTPVYRRLSHTPFEN